MVKVAWDTSALKAEATGTGKLCIGCCSEEETIVTCQGIDFGSTLNVTIDGVSLCGETSYNESCGVGTPFDPSASYGDPNAGPLTLTYKSLQPYGFSPGSMGYHVEEGDWHYIAQCFNPSGWVIHVMPTDASWLRSLLNTGGSEGSAQANSLSSANCGVGNCEDTTATCGYSGTSLLEKI